MACISNTMDRKDPCLILFFAVTTALFSIPLPALSIEMGTDIIMQEKKTGDNRVVVTLIPEIPGLVSAEADAADNRSWFWLGVQMDILDGWHVYWRNPGDSGLPTRINWEKHDYLIPGEIHWPVPSRFDEDGITTYGYSGRVTLMVPVYISQRAVPSPTDQTVHSPTDKTVPSPTDPVASFLTNRDTTLFADMNWLVCKEICLPESARIQLEVDHLGHFSGHSDTAEATISTALQTLSAVTDAWEGSAVYGDGSFLITLIPAADAGNPYNHGAEAFIPGSDGIYFYPCRQGLIEHTAPQSVSISSNSIQIEVKASRYLRAMPAELSGIITAEEYWIEGSGLTAIELRIPVSTKSTNH